MRCNARISLNKDATAETYCCLENGHKGEHSAFSSEIYQKHFQCESKDGNGVRCGLPKGHHGKHQNGVARRTWE